MPLCMSTTFVLPTHNSKKNPGYFYFLAIVDRVAVNMTGQVLSEEGIQSFGHMSGSGTAGSCGRFSFSFPRLLHTDLQSGYIVLQSSSWSFEFLSSKDKDCNFCLTRTLP